MKLLIVLVFFAAELSNNDGATVNAVEAWWQRWYDSYMKVRSPSLRYSSRSLIRNDVPDWDRTCVQRCFQTSDCIPGLSCFHATAVEKGCCLPPLKPNKTECVIDEQCRIACESTYCARNIYPPRCLCRGGTSYLFGKCWKKCPGFAYPQPLVDDNGFSRCIVKTDTATAIKHMKRYKREYQNSRIMC